MFQVNNKDTRDKNGLTMFSFCVSGGKKCLFFGKFGVLCFLVTAILRFVHLPYYRRDKPLSFFLSPIMSSSKTMFILRTLRRVKRLKISYENILILVTFTTKVFFLFEYFFIFLKIALNL